MKLSVFDLHCDTPTWIWATGQRLSDAGGHVSLRRAERFARYTQVFAFCPYGDAFARAADLDAQARFSALLRAFSPAQQELDAAGMTPLYALEGAEAIGCDCGRLDALRAQGFRITTLTWNYANALAGSHSTGEGLTAQGRQFVRRAQALGMTVDVSHLSERAFWDLCGITTAPLIASHSNSRAVCAHSRNLTDAQAREIFAQGGLVGLNLYAPFLRDGGQATFADVYLQLAHFLALGGEKHLALGGDLDGCDCLPEGFGGVDDYAALHDYLLGRGLPRTLLANLFYHNAARFFGMDLQETDG